MAEGSKKGVVGAAGAGVVAAFTKGGAFVLAHFGLIAKPGVAGQLAGDAAHLAPTLVHAAPTMTQDAGTVLIHAMPLVKDGAEAATHSTSLFEEGVKSAGKAIGRSSGMSDSERIGRSAVGVARYYARQGLRNATQTNRDEKPSQKR